MASDNQFRVYGTPAPQGSKNGFLVGGKVRIVDQNGNSLKSWRNAVAEMAVQWRQQLQMDTLTGPVHLEIKFFMPKPPSVKRALPHVKPDLDKLIRSTLDALTTAGVYKDDALVVSVYASKEYVKEQPGYEAGALITVVKFA